MINLNAWFQKHGLCAETSYTFTAKTAKLSFNAQTVQNLHYSYRYTVFYLLCRRRIF